MPKTVPVRNGIEIIEVEFPDEMGGPEIEIALAKRFGKRAPPDPGRQLKGIVSALGELTKQVKATEPTVTLEMPDNTEELLSALEGVMTELRGLADAFSNRAAPAYELTTTRDKWGNIVSAIMQPIPAEGAA